MGKLRKNKSKFRVADTKPYVCAHCQTVNPYAIAECRTCGAPPPYLQSELRLEAKLEELGSGWMDLGMLLVCFGPLEALLLGVRSTMRHDSVIGLGALFLFFGFAYCIDPVRRQKPIAFVFAGFFSLALAAAVALFEDWLYALFPLVSAFGLFGGHIQALRREAILP